MSGRFPEARVRVPAVTQVWRHVSFVHWPVDPDVIAPHLPEGVVPDLYDGGAWLSLTPFVVVDPRIAGVAPIGRARATPETNLRTYVVGPDGRDGIWFLSVDTNDPAYVATGRLLAPYHLARMDVSTSSEVLYRGDRIGASAGYDISVHPGRTSRAPSDLDWWLVGRWRSYTKRGPVHAVVDVEHEPWPLVDAELVSCRETITTAAGVPGPRDDVRVHFAPGVSVRVGPPRPVVSAPRAGEARAR